jgi:hypothetical protein
VVSASSPGYRRRRGRNADERDAEPGLRGVRAIDIPGDRALEAAAVLSRRDDDVSSIKPN